MCVTQYGDQNVKGTCWFREEEVTEEREVDDDKEVCMIIFEC